MARGDPINPMLAQPCLDLFAADGITVVGVLLVLEVAFTTCLKGKNSQKLI